MLDTNDMLELLAKNVDCLETALNGDAHTLYVCDTTQRSLLHWAALRGSHEHVQLLLATIRKRWAEQCVADLIVAADDTGLTPLICAALRGDATICGWLLAEGADVNAATQRGNTALQYACSKGWPDCVDVLLAAGADVGARDVRHDTVLHRLAGLGRTELMRRVLQAAADRGEAVLSALVDVQNVEGDTALHIACGEAETACALLLVEHGAEVDVANRAKKTALEVAGPALRRTLTERVEKMDKAGK